MYLHWNSIYPITNCICHFHGNGDIRIDNNNQHPFEQQLCAFGKNPSDAVFYL